MLTGRFKICTLRIGIIHPVLVIGIGILDFD
nr:MAG TPA: hypothetical protein [Caudoviricetes sp.]